ncbi:hypothetical protein HHL17_16795 [Chitinophaga sp. G-6-1-13]|uniref:Uncharacterized protein n=1 Tax=Chitinophaga fulva TaxID=2728842 RepID=A0A848GLQ4_9BACT|nr:hypothetical protein [Chitinophaga fulva]NML38867.1 hypothetical protein [Chitinophaga fulva]
MTLRRLLPYILIVVLFAGIYWLTMVTSISFLQNIGYPCPTRFLLQFNLFVFYLPVCLFIINALEIITVYPQTFWSRALKTFLTIILVYVTSAVVWYLMGRPDVRNLFGGRVRPHMPCLATMFISLVLMTGLEILQRIVFRFVSKTVVSRYIPHWLRMGSTTTH